MPHWDDALLAVLLLLLGALVLGALTERLRLSSIPGYLLAGTLLGPNAFKLIHEPELVEPMAELGVALLLFTIGLEFSWRRLRGMGAVALGGGGLQIGLTMAAALLIALFLGTTWPAAIVIGAATALSSTAIVLRTLKTRTQLDAVHGRLALGVLLVQDLAVVPLVLLVSLLGRSGEEPIWMTLLRTLLAAGALLGGFRLLFHVIVPRLLTSATMRDNRELPVILATVTGLGSAWLAATLGLSASLGAFVAGILLAESPFATQVRADVGSLKTILLTLFFSTIGMLADPAWIAAHWMQVTLGAMLVVLGKSALAWIALKPFRPGALGGLGAGIAIAQVGEFAFVLAALAQGVILTEDQFSLIISITLVTMFISPVLIARAPALAVQLAGVLRTLRVIDTSPVALASGGAALEGHLVVIGYGPAGQAAIDGLADPSTSVVVIDLNHRTIAEARRHGRHGLVGDATLPEVLQHASIETARAVLVTIPAPEAARAIIQATRAAAPHTLIAARARYHLYNWELVLAGAHIVVDEETEVGAVMARELGALMSTTTTD